MLTTKKFSKGEAVRFGWSTMKNNLGFFIGLLITVALIYIIEGIVEGFMESFTRVRDEESFPILLFILYVIIRIAFSLLNLVIGMGLIKISLRYCDSERAKIGDLFSCFPLFFKYLFGSIIYGLIILGGMILLIIPGIIWSIKFQFWPALVVDKGLGPIEALKRSATMTTGIKWDLFVFDLLLAVINLLGVLCLLIGLFATIPTTMVGWAFVYRKLLAQGNFGH